MTLNEEQLDTVVGGATAIEYGLTAVLIAIVIIVGVTGAGTHLSTAFNQISSHL